MNGFGGLCFHWTRTSYSARDGSGNDVDLCVVDPGVSAVSVAGPAWCGTGVSASGRPESGCGSRGKIWRPCNGAVRKRTGTHLIPNRSGFRFVDCPNCAGGAEENQLSWLDRGTRTGSSASSATCGFQTSYTRENGVMRVTNPRGEVQEYPYWEAPFPRRRSCRDRFLISSPTRSTGTISGQKGWYVRPNVFFGCGPINWVGLLSHEELGIRSKSGVDSGSLCSGLSGVLRPVRRAVPDQGGIRGDHAFPYPVSPYLAAKWDYWAYGISRRT